MPDTNERRIRSVSWAVFLTTLALLMLEILLIRVFDVIVVANVGFVIITMAMFASGLAGVYATIRPIGADAGFRTRVPMLSLVLALAIVGVRPALNATPIIYERLPDGPMQKIVAAAAMYLILIVPFFISGVILAYTFSAFRNHARRLYFWDLAGAALGCVIFFPFLRRLGPGGLMFWGAAASVLASGLFAGKRAWSIMTVALATVLVLGPLAKNDGYFEFHMHLDKRGVRIAELLGQIEFSEWGPISKIDVLDTADRDGASRPKYVAYDGGSQSSTLFPFDGNYDGLRRKVISGSEDITRHFWRRGVLVSHYLKRDTGAEVLIVGSAAGQETKAALLFNAASVEGVELVDTIVRLGQRRYAGFIGNIFNDSRVHNQAGEGRSYLRMTDKKYDILQIFSNHTSSNIASGIGATNPVYLQTVEAYREYFSHLKDDGILHINHHFYPRMITTAARAWRLMGRTDFQAHVIVYEAPGGDTLPTMLVKASRWTEREAAEVASFFALPDVQRARIVVDPFHRDAAFLTPEFFSGELPAELLGRMDYLVQPPTDDWPYFNNIQKGLKRVELDPKRFLDEAMTQAVNGRLGLPLGEYAIFAVVGVVAVILSLLTILVPARVSMISTERWPAAYISLAYFSCLGAAFIIVELVLIQIFMKLVGFPVYTFSVVIFTMLAAAGLGSIAADRFGVTPHRRWTVPFAGILSCGAALLWSYPFVFDVFLAEPEVTRIAVAAGMIFPLAFFMGVPFPLGILSLENAPRAAVAWAWGTNALFTVIGGAAAGLLSLFLGFRQTLFVALAIYLLAFGIFSRFRLFSRNEVTRADHVPMTEAQPA